MNVKSITFLVFASLGLIAFPLAVSSHLHLFADGAYYFARLVETRYIPTSGSRFLGIIITQLPTFLALQAGTSDISILSYIYGTSLYYFPFICYAIAACLLIQKGMHTHAILLVLMYTILIYLTSYFIISESHFSSGLFVLAISIIVTRSMRSITPPLTLACIGIVAMFSYEFWAIFFPICIVFFLYRTIGRDTPPAIKLLQGFIVLLYIAGAISNINAIIFPRDIVNRNAMFSTQIHNVWYLILAACLFFGSAILYSRYGPMLIHVLNTGRLNSRIRFPYLQRPDVVFHLALLVTFAVFSVFFYFRGIPNPQNAYALRSLNLFLPLLFALCFLPSHRKPPYSASARTIALYFVFPILVLTMQASLYNTSRWLVFKDSFFTATQQHSGFVSINKVKITNPEFLWGWTSPTFSILVQAMQGGNVQSILFNPNATWQPYDPSDGENAARLAKSMHSNFVITGIGK